MTLDALKCFCAVVETRSFKAAADRVFRSQPAISQQVKSLERELGHVLIERRTVTPTAIGQLLYRRGRNLLLATESLEEELADIDNAWSRDLRIGSSDTTALYILPPFIRAFSKAMPQTRVTTISRSTDAITQQALHGQVDLGIVTLPLDHPDLEEQTLWRLQLALVVPKNHPHAHRKQLKLRELNHEPYLMLHPETRTGALLTQHFQRTGFEPRVVLDSGSFEVIKRYISAGLGVSILPATFIGAADDLAAIDVKDLPVLRIGAIWRRGAYQSRAARELLGLLQQALPLT